MECIKGFLAWIEFHPGLAGWIQAVGSLLAVALTLTVVFIQHRLLVNHTKAQEKKADLAVANALLSLGLELEVEMRYAFEVLEKYEWDEIDRASKRFEHLDAIIQALSVERLINIGMTFEWFFLKKTAKQCAVGLKVSRIPNQKSVELDDTEMTDILVESHLNTENIKKKISELSKIR